MFICTAITFNHESPLRHEEFITRKLTKAAARIKYGLQDRVRIGNMYAKRDWGHSQDYVKAFWMMLNLNKEPIDYILATEQCATVKEFAELAFREVGFNNLEW